MRPSYKYLLIIAVLVALAVPTQILAEDTPNTILKNFISSETPHPIENKTQAPQPTTSTTNIELKDTPHPIPTTNTARAETPQPRTQEFKISPQIRQEDRNSTAKDASGGSREFERIDASSSPFIKLENVEQEIEIKRQEVKVKEEKRQVVLKATLKEFKDQNKAQIVKQIDQKFGQVNTTITTAMATSVDKLNSVIATLEQRVAMAKAQGKDTTLAEAAIAQAKTSISTAQNVVTAQASKDYGLSTTSENSAKNDVSTVRNTLNTDLKNTQIAIMAAKQATQDALKIAVATIGSN